MAAMGAKSSFWQGRQAGFGTLYFPNGEQYSGEVEDGQMHGRGRFIHRNGDAFQGSWCAPAR